LRKKLLLPLAVIDFYMKHYLLSIIFLSFWTLHSYGQADSSFVSSPDTGSDEFSFFFNEEETAKYLNYKPIIGIGMGSIKFFGDVKDVYYSNPIMGNTAVNLSVSRDLNDFFTAHFNAVYGILSGSERTPERNLNFKTDILNGALLLSYNFYHILRKPDLLIPYKEQRRLIPMLSVGVSAFNFSSKGDLYDAEGRKYYYWSDGSVRDREESQRNEYSSVVLQRDYDYETDLRESDLDGLGKYTKTAFAVPIDLSLEYNLHKRAVVKLGATYYWVFNDNVDNISKNGVGKRQGNSGGDNYLYTYVSLKFDLFSDEKEVSDGASMFVSADIIEAIKAEDRDLDNVVDIWDNCLETPVGVKVDDFGCPLDDDQDGFPNYRDKEIHTEKDSITNMEGVKLSMEEWIAFSDTSDAINYEDICEYYPSLCYDNPQERYRNLFVKMPEKFKVLDVNKDDYISIEEISKAIDDFFNMTSKLSIDDIYELTEFFFSQ